MAITSQHLLDEEEEELSYAKVEALLVGGADTEIPDMDGNTPIFCSVARSFVKVVRLFIDSGANVNHMNKMGKTPLFLACLTKNKECIDVLLKAGARVSLVDFADLSARGVETEITDILRASG